MKLIKIRIIILLIIGGLIFWLIFALKTKETMQFEGFRSSSEIIETSAEYKISVGKSIKVKDSPLIVELIEIDTNNRKCKLGLSNSSTGQHIIFWAFQDQPIKEIEKFFTPHALRILNLTDDSVTVLVPDKAIIKSEIYSGEN